MINPFNVFFHPQKTVESFMEKPSMAIALVFVLLPSLLVLLLSSVYSFGFDLTEWAMNFLAKDIAVWIVAGVLIYVLVFALKGWKVEGKLTGILASVSLVSFIKIVIFILFLIVMNIVSPNFFSVAAEVMQNWPMEMQDILAVVQADLLLPLGAVGLVLLVLYAIVAFVMSIISLYVIYKIIAVSAPSSTARNVLIFVIMLGFFLVIATVL